MGVQGKKETVYASLFFSLFYRPLVPFTSSSLRLFDLGMESKAPDPDACSVEELEENVVLLAEEMASRRIKHKHHSHTNQPKPATVATKSGPRTVTPRSIVFNKKRQQPSLSRPSAPAVSRKESSQEKSVKSLDDMEKEMQEIEAQIALAIPFPSGDRRTVDRDQFSKVSEQLSTYLQERAYFPSLSSSISSSISAPPPPPVANPKVPMFPVLQKVGNDLRQTIVEMVANGQTQVVYDEDDMVQVSLSLDRNPVTNQPHIQLLAYVDAKMWLHRHNMATTSTNANVDLIDELNRSIKDELDRILTDAMTYVRNNRIGTEKISVGAAITTLPLRDLFGKHETIGGAIDDALHHTVVISSDISQKQEQVLFQHERPQWSWPWSKDNPHELKQLSDPSSVQSVAKKLHVLADDLIGQWKTYNTQIKTTNDTLKAQEQSAQANSQAGSSNWKTSSTFLGATFENLKGTTTITRDKINGVKAITAQATGDASDKRKLMDILDEALKVLDANLATYRKRKVDINVGATQTHVHGLLQKGLATISEQRKAKINDLLNTFSKDNGLDQEESDKIRSLYKDTFCLDK